MYKKLFSDANILLAGVEEVVITTLGNTQENKRIKEKTHQTN